MNLAEQCRQVSLNGLPGPLLFNHNLLHFYGSFRVNRSHLLCTNVRLTKPDPGNLTIPCCKRRSIPNTTEFIFIEIGDGYNGYGHNTNFMVELPITSVVSCHTNLAQSVKHPTSTHKMPGSSLDRSIFSR